MPGCFNVLILTYPCTYFRRDANDDGSLVDSLLDDDNDVSATAAQYDQQQGQNYSSQHAVTQAQYDQSDGGGKQYHTAGYTHHNQQQSQQQYTQSEQQMNSANANQALDEV